MIGLWNFIYRLIGLDGTQLPRFSIFVCCILNSKIIENELILDLCSANFRSKNSIFDCNKNVARHTIPVQIAIQDHFHRIGFYLFLAPKLFSINKHLFFHSYTFYTKFQIQLRWKTKMFVHFFPIFFDFVFSSLLFDSHESTKYRLFSGLHFIFSISSFVFAFFLFHFIWKNREKKNGKFDWKLFGFRVFVCLWCSFFFWSIWRLC